MCLGACEREGKNGGERKKKKRGRELCGCGQ